MLAILYVKKAMQVVALKLIRRNFKRTEKNSIPLFLKAFSVNGESFYAYAPKQNGNGNVKKLSKYIVRYIHRPEM